MSPQIAQQPVYTRSLYSFYITQALYNLMFFLPTWVIYLQERHGLSLTQVTLINMAFWLTMALTEVPTGAVADTYGRKQSMLLGFALCSISVAVFGWAPNFALLMIANSIWGMAMTFLSGADMAFFFDTLQAIGRQHEYPRLRGQLSAVSLIGAAVGNFLGGFLATRSLEAPFMAYSFVLGLAFLIGLGLKEAPRSIDQETQKPASTSKILRLAWVAIQSQRNLQFILLYSNFLPLANMLITTTFIQPHMREIGIPLAWMGVVVFGLSMVRMAGSISAGKLSQLGRVWLWIAPCMLVSGLVCLALIPNIVGVSLFSLSIFGSIASRPLIEGLILQSAPQSARATIFSADNLIFRLILTVFEPATGIMADRFGLPSAFLILAFFIGLSLLIVLVLWHPILIPPDIVKPI